MARILRPARWHVSWLAKLKDLSKLVQIFPSDNITVESFAKEVSLEGLRTLNAADSLVVVTRLHILIKHPQVETAMPLLEECIDQL